jgi:iron(III) transport system substrate-binding protein
MEHTIKRICAAIIVIIMAACVFSGCGKENKTVVIYTSVDQVFSEQIFELFEAETGIKVLPVYDIEAQKTVGLANKLIEEKKNPQADVFWNGEILQMIKLKEERVLASIEPEAAGDLPEAFVDDGGCWFGFGGRARVLIYNKTLIAEDQCPKTMKELAESKYLGNTGIAYPVFGTTSTQVAVLYTYLGAGAAKSYFASLKTGGISVVEGNSVVKDYVDRKKLYMGLTDTDDALEAMEGNKDLSVIFLDQGVNDMGTLVIPNTVAMIKGAAHSEEAMKFIEFLLSAQTEQKLVNIGWIHIPVHAGVTPTEKFNVGSVKVMAVDFGEVYKNLEPSKNDMIELFGS